MKKLFSTLLALLLVVGMTACAASTPANKPDTTADTKTETTQTQTTAAATGDYIVGGGSSGGTYNAVSSVFAQFWNKANLGSYTAQATTGSGQNILFIQRGDIEFGMANASVCIDAVNGLGQFEGNAYPELRAMFMIYPGVFQQFVTTSSGIETEADLFGKKLAIGGPGSGDVVAAEEVYGAFGMTLNDFDPQYLGSGEAADNMKDGHIDGLIGIAQAPFSVCIEMTSESINKAKVISLSDETIEKLTTGEGAKYFPYTIPAGTYGNQTEDVKTIANGQLMVTRADADEELVYQMVKAVFENLPELSILHTALADMSVEEAIEVSGIQLHPGAERYYKEVGILG